MSQLSCRQSPLVQTLCLVSGPSEKGEKRTGQCRHFGQLAVLVGKAMSWAASCICSRLPAGDMGTLLEAGIVAPSTWPSLVPASVVCAGLNFNPTLIWRNLVSSSVS